MFATTYLRDNARHIARTIDCVTYDVNIDAYNVRIELHGARALWDYDVVYRFIEQRANDAKSIEHFAQSVVRNIADSLRTSDYASFHYIKCWVTRTFATGSQTIFVERFNSQWD